MATATISTRSIQGESLSAANDRLVNTALLREGVIDFASDSYKVAQDTGSNMQVKIGSGTAFDRAVVEGDNAGQGAFICEHANATQTLAVAAADATNPRIDIVVLRIYDDTFDSSGLDEADLEVIQGTPAGSPVAPATPNSALKLAEIEVGAAVTAITDANITDSRSEAVLRSEVVAGSSIEGQVLGINSSGNQDWLGGAQLIERKVLAAAATAVTFSSIPGDFRDLLIIGSGKRDTAGDQRILMRFNGDSGTNYTALLNTLLGDGTSSVLTGDAETFIRAGQWGGGVAGQMLEAKIVNYADNIAFKGVSGSSWGRSGGAAADRSLTNGGGTWKDSSPITSVELSIVGSFASNSVFSLYGLS